MLENVQLALLWAHQLQMLGISFARFCGRNGPIQRVCVTFLASEKGINHWEMEPESHKHPSGTVCYQYFQLQFAFR